MFFLLNSFALCHGKYVTELTTKSFRKLVEGRNDTTVWMVDFQGDYCPACRQAAPWFAEAAKQSLGMVKFGSVDTTKNQEIAGQFNIRYIPTFIIFYPGGHKTYVGERSPRGFCNAAAKYIPSSSTEVDETWIGDKSKSVILFSNKRSVPPMWAAVSNYFKENNQEIKIGHSLDGNHKDDFNITAFPTVLATDGDKQRIFDGKPNFQKLRVFIERFFNGTLPDPTPRPTPKPKEARIQEIDTEEKFEKVCHNHKNCVIMAGKPTEEFKKIALKFQHDPFVFAYATETSELNYINKGIWVFHRTTPRAHIVDSEEHLTTALDRVLDGSQKWKSVADIREGLEL